MGTSKRLITRLKRKKAKKTIWRWGIGEDFRRVAIEAGIVSLRLRSSVKWHLRPLEEFDVILGYVVWETRIIRWMLSPAKCDMIAIRLKVRIKSIIK